MSHPNEVRQKSPDVTFSLNYRTKKKKRFPWQQVEPQAVTYSEKTFSNRHQNKQVHTKQHNTRNLFIKNVPLERFFLSPYAR